MREIKILLVAIATSLLATWLLSKYYNKIIIIPINKFIGYPTLATKANMTTRNAEILFQKQLYAYKGTPNNTLKIWTAVCDERMTSSVNRTAVHVFVYLKRKFAEDEKTRRMLQSSWKCRMYYTSGQVDVQLSSAISGHQNFHALFSCFFSSNRHKCPSYVSIIPGWLHLSNYSDSRNVRYFSVSCRVDDFRMRAKKRSGTFIFVVATIYMEYQQEFRQLHSKRLMKIRT